MNPDLLPSRQHGVALAVGLIFLLVLTVIGLAAMRVSTSQTLQAASYQFSTISFQAAESAISAIMGEIRGDIDPATLDPPPVSPFGNILVDAINATQPDQRPVRPTDQTELSAGPRTVNTAATVTSDNPDGSGPPLAGFSIGGSVSAYRFSVRSIASVPNTAARADHQQGLVRLGPSP